MTAPARGRPHIVTAVVTAIVVSVVVAPLTAYASHSFSDVPDSHPFHDAIANLDAACITRGYPDGTFRPSTNISRGEEAALTSRAAGRIAEDLATGNASFGSQWTEIAAVSVRTPGIRAGCQQYVHLHATVKITNGHPSGCAQPPCRVHVGLFRAGNPDQMIWSTNLSTAAWPSSLDMVIPIQRRVTQTAGLLPTYLLQVRLEGAASPTSGAVWSGPVLIATTHPLGDDVGN